MVAPVGAGGAVLGAGAPVDYDRQVKPLLKDRCYACHGALKQKARLRLDSGAAIRRGGVSGAAVQVGKGEESLLIDRVNEDDPKHRMPPKGAPLSDEQIGILRGWIDQGAISPPGETSELDPREHWAFRKPGRVSVHTVQNVEWVRSPIDVYLSAEHEQRGLRPLSAAEPQVLLRRLYLDLIGLPPTREQLHDFLAEPSDRAYEQIVDRLLASPQYGERWARHWMDVWRYSDWYGRRAVPDVLNSYAMIWRWRDWIVRSLNQDKGYDWMIRQMLAADEFDSTNDANLVATGYLVRNFFRWNYNTWMKDNVEHTAKAFLGLTMGCAHCHDHKYDPISQQDYFALRACFEPIEIRHDRVPGEPDPGPYRKYDYGKAYGPITSGMVRVFDEKLDAKTFLYSGGESRNIVTGRPPILPGVLRFLGGASFHVEPVTLPPEAFYPGLKEFVQAEEIQRRQSDVVRRERALADLKKPIDPAIRKIHEAELAAARLELDSVRARIAADLVRYGKRPGDVGYQSRAAARAERSAALAQTLVSMIRAELAVALANAKSASNATARSAHAKAEQQLAQARQAVDAARAALSKQSSEYTPLSPIYPARTTGRRAALARWIGSSENPLTARVAVNHIWRWHFHQPLVASTYDFGRNGKQPTHPALLDWLAAEFVRQGWSMKALHRLIVTSAAYRMRSHADQNDDNHKRDPENRGYWHFTPARVESEVVRDSLLSVAGALDLAIGGPDIDFNQGFTTRRRSLYLTHHGEGRMPFLELFDAPEVCEAYVRTTSVVPQQALALTNNELARSLASELARRLWNAVVTPNAKHSGNGPDDAVNKASLPALSLSGPGNGAFVAAAFEQALCRRPTAAELERSLEFLASQERLFAGRGSSAAASGTSNGIADPAGRSRQNLIHALLCHNDFLTVH
jgi:hypothetical protein